jgi:hypothetical protein
MTPFISRDLRSQVSQCHQPAPAHALDRAGAIDAEGAKDFAAPLKDLLQEGFAADGHALGENANCRARSWRSFCLAKSSKIIFRSKAREIK